MVTTVTVTVTVVATVTVVWPCPIGPSNLTATAEATAQQILIEWTDNASNETGFKLERSANGGATWLDIVWLGASVTMYVDRDVDRGATYHYRARAYNANGDSAYSNTDNDTVYDVTDEADIVLQLVGEEGTYISDGGAFVDVGSVGFWEDQSGDGNDFEQTTAAKKPYKFGIRIDYNRGTVYFDGTDALMTASNFLSSSDGIVLAVHKLTALANAANNQQEVLTSWDEATAALYGWVCRALVDDVSPQNMEVGQNNNDGWDNIRGDTAVVAAALYLDVWRSDGAAYTLRKNRAEEGLTIRNGANTGDWLGDTANRDNFVVGAAKFNQETGFYYGDIAELIMLDADPADAVMNRIERYLANDYWRRTETFMDETYVGAYAGVSYQVNTPTKYASNPIFGGAGGETWDDDKYYPTVIKIDDAFIMWYSAVDDHGAQLNVCYATSDDGIAWTKPTLNLVTYDGDTNNNIIMASGEYGIHVVYDPGATYPYVGVTELHGVVAGAHIWTSANGINWTYRQNIEVTAVEGKGITRRPDGRYIVYAVAGQLAQDREVLVLLSDTADPTGAWTEIGIEITSPNQDDQKYHCSGLWYGENGMNYLVVGDYNKTAETIHANLYSVRAGYGTETLESDGWIPLGAGAAWDDEMVIADGKFVRVGDDWRIYYSGSPEDHAAAAPRDSRVGFATIGFERIGAVTGTGTLTTKAFLPGAPLYVNVDASGGSAELVAELLDTSDTPIGGYEDTDCDPITEDTYEKEITWGGNPILTDREVKIKFYLTSATLYAYHV